MAGQNHGQNPLTLAAKVGTYLIYPRYIPRYPPTHVPMTTSHASRRPGGMVFRPYLLT